MSAVAAAQDLRQARVFGRLVVTEIKLAWRYPIGVLVAVLFPLAFVIVFGTVPSLTRPDKAFGGMSPAQAYVPIMSMLMLIFLAAYNLPVPLAVYRGQGVLRRMSTTPVPASWLLAAQVAVNVILAIIAEAIIVGLGGGVFGLEVPRQVGGYLLSLVLVAAAVFGFGLVVTAVCRTQQAASALGTPQFFVLAFFAGTWIPQSTMSPTLRDIATATPSGAAVKALEASFAGQFPGAEPLLVLAGWAVLLALAAVRLFRWE